MTIEYDDDGNLIEITTDLADENMRLPLAAGAAEHMSYIDRRINTGDGSHDWQPTDDFYATGGLLTELMKDTEAAATIYSSVGAYNTAQIARLPDTRGGPGEEDPRRFGLEDAGRLQATVTTAHMNGVIGSAWDEHVPNEHALAPLASFGIGYVPVVGHVAGAAQTIAGVAENMHDPPSIPAATGNDVQAVLDMGNFSLRSSLVIAEHNSGSDLGDRLHESARGQSFLDATGDIKPFDEMFAAYIDPDNDSNELEDFLTWLDSEDLVGDRTTEAGGDADIMTDYGNLKNGAEGADKLVARSS